jgi:hypothetical protein
MPKSSRGHALVDAMWLKLIPINLSMSSRTTFGEKAGTTHTLYFTLHLAGQDRLTLETGEVFQNAAYKQNAISAHMNLYPASGEGDPSPFNRMSYSEGVSGDDSAPSSINFHVSIPASDYSLLLDNIRGGINPEWVMVELRLDYNGTELPLYYAPDGSKVWRNAKHWFVDVDSIVFQYRLIGADDGDDAVANTAKASTPKIDASSVAIAATLADLERAFTKTKTLIVTVIIVACAVLYFALR